MVKRQKDSSMLRKEKKKRDKCSPSKQKKEERVHITQPKDTNFRPHLQSVAGKEKQEAGRKTAGNNNKLI